MKALHKARFRKPAFVELLLEKSREAQLVNPEQAEALALMAASVTVQLHKPNEDGALIAVFMARAHCLAGNALLGSEADAEIAFGNTAYFLARSPVSCDRAFYCRALAVLRWEQGRIDEAAALLYHAAGIFEENGALGEEGTCLALAGLLYTEEGDARAVPPLAVGPLAARLGARAGRPRPPGPGALDAPGGLAALLAAVRGRGAVPRPVAGGAHLHPAGCLAGGLRPAGRRACPRSPRWNWRCCSRNRSGRRRPAR